jgi:hypothetical protein
MSAWSIPEGQPALPGLFGNATNPWAKEKILAEQQRALR